MLIDMIILGLTVNPLFTVSESLPFVYAKSKVLLSFDFEKRTLFIDFPRIDLKFFYSTDSFPVLPENFDLTLSGPLRELDLVNYI